MNEQFPPNRVYICFSSSNHVFRNTEKKEVTWTIDEISLKSEDRGLASLKANFDVSDGPSTPGIVYTHFDGHGATFSGLEFQLNCVGYRMSLLKKHVLTGKQNIKIQTQFVQFSLFSFQDDTSAKLTPQSVMHVFRSSKMESILQSIS